MKFTLGALIGIMIAMVVFPMPVFADQIQVAVASNFTQVAKKIAAEFELKSGHKVVLIFGATGKHYAQIKHGAPFDAFLAADKQRPLLLEQQKLALSGSRFTYAIGKLVLWSPRPNVVDAEGKVLAQGEFRYLSIANPKLAPYGRAAEQVLRARSLWDLLQGRIVRGENIGQAFQFVKSGNAQLGFVAQSQIKNLNDGKVTGSFWKVPQALYEPIEQQAVLLQDNDVAREFLVFVKSNKARRIIQDFGYATP